MIRTTSASRHEARLLLASRPSLYALLRAGRLLGPVARLPRVGWVVSDAVTARRVLNDHAHFSLLGEGGVGHLWAQVLGDWVERLFDGPGHADLRARTRDLFTEESAAALVARVFAPEVGAITAELAAGRVVDLADRARVLVGRMVADLLGLERATADGDFRRVFAAGERLAALALGTTASTVVAPAVVAEARAIVAELTRDVGAGYERAGAGALLGRCRELGLSRRETEGLASLLLVAGTETAASAMARTVALLHDTGQVRRLLDDPALLPGAVREGLRVTTPAPLIGRHVTSDVTRPYVPETRQLWFGAGRHLCLGAPVARAELAELLGALVGLGRPWEVVGRRPARRVLIPSYATLRIQLVG